MGSSEGLSPYYMLLGATSMITIFWNTFLLQYGHIGCCAIQTAGDCFENIMGLIQVFLQFGCFMALVMLYIGYFPKERRYQSHVLTLRKRKTREYRQAVIVGILVFVIFVLSTVSSLALFFSLGDGQQSNVTEIFADMLGLISMITASIQFIPQIVKTLRIRQVGSLSIPSMILQTPGSFILVYTLSSRSGNNITNWITYLVTGILQAILLISCLVFKYQERKQRLVSEEFTRLLDEDDDTLTAPSETDGETQLKK
jgi:uncharacterized protein with PQ loop repeat